MASPCLNTLIVEGGADAIDQLESEIHPVKLGMLDDDNCLFQERVQLTRGSFGLRVTFRTAYFPPSGPCGRMSERHPTLLLTLMWETEPDDVHLLGFARFMAGERLDGMQIDCDELPSPWSRAADWPHAEHRVSWPKFMNRKEQ